MLKRGIPSVLVASDVFEGLARAEAEGYGCPDLPMLIVPHPMGTRSEQEARAMGEAKVAELLSLLGVSQEMPA
ncbi:MAG: hypothetical protein GEU78_13865 [Actinobacteria bacterium]|nr:hypothetical protein [Actinomycetota bacterium]